MCMGNAFGRAGGLRVADEPQFNNDRESLDMLRAYGIPEEDVQHAGALRRAMEAKQASFCTGVVTRDSMEELVELRDILLAFGLPEAEAARVGSLKTTPHGSEPAVMPPAQPVASGLDRNQFAWRTSGLVDIQE
eukprot:CAMPEP_0177763536 /NCGR_PEP_ID=MMETSP0491_2-20121128/6924_1 /TAXON_ID=63592 /ORGANISM="Tetraselmis chuii, Strain PLY429" /LENGTH=133 /DNA_ID=CAMNT_0019279651 /DNA_START=165 /DNA_END=566 /DNA_ORIENTATION=+